jgi:hypothetical protein
MRDPLRSWGARITLQPILCFAACQLEKPVKVDLLTESLLNVGRSLLSGSGLRRFDSNGDLPKNEQRLYSTSRQQFVRRPGKKRT